MKQSKTTLLSSIFALALTYAGNSSASVIYDIETQFGTLGQIGFAVADNYVGSISGTDVASFTLSGGASGDPSPPPDSSAWSVSVSGSLDANASFLEANTYGTNGTAHFEILSASTNILSPGLYNYTHDSYVFSAAVWYEAVEPVPIPAAIWLFGSGLLGLIGVARRKAA